MARNAGGRRRKRGSKQDEVVKVVNGFVLRSPHYQPTIEELEADLSFPASFDEVAGALFAAAESSGILL